MVPPPLTLDEALARGEILAANTTESTHIIRVGEWVYKLLKPLDTFPFQTHVERLRELQFRLRESQLHEELNPLAYDELRNCVISRFIRGRQGTAAEASALLEHFERTGRGYLMDIGPANVRVPAGGLVVIDFAVIETHRHWRSRCKGAPLFT